MSQELIKRLRDGLHQEYRKHDVVIDEIEQLLADADHHIGDRTKGTTFKRHRNDAFLAMLANKTESLESIMYEATQAAKLMME